MDLKSKTLIYLYDYSWWLQESYNTRDLNQVYKITVRNLDETLLILEKDQDNEIELLNKSKKLIGNKNIFNNIVKKPKSNKELAIHRNIMDFLNEIKAAEYLLKNNFYNIKIIEQNPKQKTPDFEAVLEKKLCGIEIKSLNRTRKEDNDYMISGKSFGPVNKEMILNGLEKKIDYFVNDSIGKFKYKKYDKNILLILFEPDTPVTLIYNKSSCNLFDILGINYFKEINNKNNIEIISLDN